MLENKERFGIGAICRPQAILANLFSLFFLFSISYGFTPTNKSTVSLGIPGLNSWPVTENPTCSNIRSSATSVRILRRSTLGPLFPVLELPGLTTSKSK